MKQRAIMTCEVSDPEAPVQWLFNNEPVIDDHSISTHLNAAEPNLS